MPKPSGSARKSGRGRSAPLVKSAGTKAKAKNARAQARAGNGRAKSAAGKNGRALVERGSERVVHSGKAATNAITSRGKYVYCVIEAPDALRFGPIGIGATASDVSRSTTRRSPRSSPTPARKCSTRRANTSRTKRVNRDGHARAHRHPDVVRHHLQDARGHRELRARPPSVRGRAEQDAEQARVRVEGPVGSRPR